MTENQSSELPTDENQTVVPEEENPSVWDELGALDSDSLLIPSTPPSLHQESPDPLSQQPNQDPWNWLHPPPVPQPMQVRLDGEPASNLTPSTSIDLDMFLYPLPVASGRVTKPDSSTKNKSHSQTTHSIPSSAVSKPKIEAQPKPVAKKEEKIVQTESQTSSLVNTKMENNSITITIQDPFKQTKQPTITLSQPVPSIEKPQTKPEPMVISPPPSTQNISQDTEMKIATTTSPVHKPNTQTLSPSLASNIMATTRTTPLQSLPTSSVSKPPLPTSATTITTMLDTKPKPSTAPSSLKEKRAREARQFPKEVLGSLDGTTSAEVRKMNATQRELVLYKRKLRNRESARRSRQKRQATLAELQEEIDDLMQVSGRMVEVGLSLREENNRLRSRLVETVAKLDALSNAYDSINNTNPVASGPSKSATHLSQEDPAAALQMKLGG